MKKATRHRVGIGVVAGAALALALPLAASAHVHVVPDEAAAGSSTVLTFTIGHGCDGSPTTAVSIQMPDEIISAKPVVNAGWTAQTQTEPVDGVTDQHGDPVSERTSVVDFTAKTPLADSQIDTLSVQVSLPEETAGETLAFPVEQTCETGSTSWDQVAESGEDEPEHPAPTVAVGDVDTAGHGHAEGDDAAENSDTQASASSQTDDDNDLIARIIGIAGLAVGAAGIVLAVTARRPRAKETK
ncbi:YcnI family copper-binding membrane protein [Paramicrobacterium chengjingii]|uniref:YcnI family protein n=1 Tax=Paramicrobacterium chengjingii TaxID=2769067 RepID=A0ABX6YGY6_9MICO|nr:YcnI family protein [Microbacterium chengjingii]QPZ37652.1 YcnI family protein [Microbacterium chengjingii]